MRRLYTLAFIAFSTYTFAQVQVKSSSFTVERIQDFIPRDYEPGFNASVYSLEAPDAMSWRGQLNSIKQEAAERFSEVQSVPQTQYKTAAQPALGWTSDMYRVYSSVGTVVPLYGGIPNDNTLAFSDGGIMLAAVNSFIWAYNTVEDTIHLENSFIGLDGVGPDANNDRGFDPKLIYDRDADRFILVFLKNNSPNNSKIAVCFSSTNDPEDPWHVYILPGNPLNNDRWTDFPAISTTEDHLYITGNLIIPNVSWQVGFDGSIIWQLDKAAGFAGDMNMPNRLYHDIRFGSRYIRNLHPVKGYNGDIDTAYFLSNRNFDMQNDSIFVLSLHSDITGTEDLRIKVEQSDIPYGVPPNGRQVDTDPTDPTDGLQTNDARVLGAIRMSNGDIQFVSTTRNFTTQRANIFHGIVHNPGSSSSSITGQLIGDGIKDYGYPNLAWTGNEECDNEVIIGFNHTSPSDFAGMSAVYYSNDGDYSDVLTIKTGDNYVQRLNGGDRWGDYFGIQTDYSNPGKVYLAGFYGTDNGNNSAYFAELTSPDSAKLVIQPTHTSSNSICNQNITLSVSGGVPPYSIFWNGEEGNETRVLCGGEEYEIFVTDARGCEATLNYQVPFDIPNESMVYPNPAVGPIGVVFDAPQAGQVQVQLSDLNGKQIWIVTETDVQRGKHYLEFDLSPVASGIYVLDIIQNDEAIFTQKIIKN